MTERELRAVAEAIRNALIGTKEVPKEDICVVWGRAAISASDSKYVKGLVEALKLLQDISDVSFVNDQEYNYQQQIIDTALQNLPEDRR